MPSYRSRRDGGLAVGRALVRRTGRRLRRITWVGVVGTVLALAGLVVILGVLLSPPPSATTFRTEPVLRALRMIPDEPVPADALTEPVASLSVSPRLSLPMVAPPVKRVLPLPEMDPPVAAAPAAPEADAAPEPALAPEPAPAPEIAAAPPAAPAARPAPPPRPVVAALVVPPPPPPPLPSSPPAGAPRLAIVIDDLGPAHALSVRATRLPRPVTLAILPYGERIPELVASARANGHEIFLHLPMEPLGSENPGPNAILTGLDGPEIDRRLAWAFAQVPGAVGVNNHMGSRATADPSAMRRVLGEVRRRGLVFVDSRTSPNSVGHGLAGRLGLAHAARDVFLDNDPAKAAILARLEEAERLARRRGQALAIGHPYPTTLAVLAQWLPQAEARGVKLVHASALASRACTPAAGTVQVSACSGADCLPPCE